MNPLQKRIGDRVSLTPDAGKIVADMLRSGRALSRLVGTIVGVSGSGSAFVFRADPDGVLTSKVFPGDVYPIPEEIADVYGKDPT